jgi:rubrerythrin
MVQDKTPLPEVITSVDEAIDFAIGQEEKAAAFYRSFAKRATAAGVKKKCEEMALEEDRHKATLIDVKAGLENDLATRYSIDLKISDYLRDFTLPDSSDQQDLLIAAMKSEARAEKLYQHMASACQKPDVREILLRLAAEEGKHKLDLEEDYDDKFLSTN